VPNSPFTITKECLRCVNLESSCLQAGPKPINPLSPADSSLSPNFILLGEFKESKATRPGVFMAAVNWKRPWSSPSPPHSLVGVCALASFALLFKCRKIVNQVSRV
jgi:hypothetical protein